VCCIGKERKALRCDSPNDFCDQESPREEQRDFEGTLISCLYQRGLFAFAHFDYLLVEEASRLDGCFGRGDQPQ
jgi:hypothetical protein